MSTLQERFNAAQLQSRLDAAKAAKGVFDQETGAPPRVRMLVDSARSPEDKLTTLKSFFPDARPFVTGNYIFTHPETGRETLYNPGGFEFGDVAGEARIGAEIVGGTAGAMLGAPGGPAGSAVGAGTGAMAGAEIFDRLVARPMGMADTRTAAQQAADAGLTFGFNVAGQAVGQTGGRMIAEGTKRALGGGRKVAGDVAERIGIFERSGVSPSVAQATDRPWVDSLESFLSKTPGSAGRFRKVANRTIETLQSNIERRAQSLAGRAGVDAEIAGRSVQKGVTNWVGETFRPKAGKLYSELDKYVPQQQPIRLDRMRSALDELGDAVPDNPALSAILSSPQIRALREALGEGTELPYGVVKQIRSAIGRKLSSPSLVDDAPRAELKQLYGALTQDMETAARQAGPEATKALHRANDYWRAGMGRVEDFLEGITKKVEPETVVKLLESKAKTGGTAIRAITKSLAPEERKVLAASIVRRLGRAKGSAQDETGELFSLETFLTNWANMTPSAKRALFQGPGLEGVYDSLENIAKIAGITRESARVFQNPSGTAGQLIGQGIIYGGGSAGMGAALGGEAALAFLAGMTGVGLGANQIARLLTNPKFVRWLAKTSEVKPAGLAAHVGRLGATMASENPELVEATRDYLSSLLPGTEQ